MARTLTSYDTFKLTLFRILQQYEYAMSARFKSPGSDQLVTCKIASSILEPFFGVKPVSGLSAPAMAYCYNVTKPLLSVVARAI